VPAIHPDFPPVVSSLSLLVKQPDFPPAENRIVHSVPDCGKVYFIQPYVIKVISDLCKIGGLPSVIKVISDLCKIGGLPSVSAVNPHKNTKIYLGNWYKTVNYHVSFILRLWAVMTVIL
jgi:hypothetical protein